MYVHLAPKKVSTVASHPVYYFRNIRTRYAIACYFRDHSSGTTHQHSSISYTGKNTTSDGTESAINDKHYALKC